MVFSNSGDAFGVRRSLDARSTGARCQAATWLVARGNNAVGIKHKNSVFVMEC